MFNTQKYRVDLVIKLIMFALLLLLIVSVKAQQVSGTVDHPLFYVYTKNRVTAYELNFESKDNLDRGNPFKISIQKLLGTTIKNEINFKYLGNEAFEIRLVAYQKIPLYLLRTSVDRNYKLYLKNGGESLLLKRISVKINKGSFKRPNYQYIDLVPVEKKL